MMLIIRASLSSSYGKNVAKPHNKPKDAQFAKLCMLHASESSFLPTFLELCIKTTFCRSYVKILAEPNCGPEDVQFPNSDTCITVFSQTYGAYHQNDTLKLFPQNCHLTPLRPKTLQLSKILSHDPESSFLSNDLLLILRVTFWSCYCKILAKPYYCPKVGQFAKHCQTPHNNPSQLVFLAYHQSVNLEPLR